MDKAYKSVRGMAPVSSPEPRLTVWVGRAWEPTILIIWVNILLSQEAEQTDAPAEQSSQPYQALPLSCALSPLHLLIFFKKIFLSCPGWP